MMHCTETSYDHISRDKTAGKQVRKGRQGGQAKT